MKENQNLLGYNVWSAGEYKNSLIDMNYIPPQVVVKTTTEYSFIGENSIQLKTTSNNWQNFMLSGAKYSAGTLTAKAHIRVVSGMARFRLVNMSNTIIAAANVSAGTCDEITINGVNTPTEQVRVMISTNSDDVLVYVDNISLTLD